MLQQTARVAVVPVKTLCGSAPSALDRRAAIEIPRSATCANRGCPFFADCSHKDRG